MLNFGAATCLRVHLQACLLRRAIAFRVHLVHAIVFRLHLVHGLVFNFNTPVGGKATFLINSLSLSPSPSPSVSLHVCLLLDHRPQSRVYGVRFGC